MGTASLVLGIISLVIGGIPFVCFFAFTIAITGLILGIISTIKKSKTGEKKGTSIAGLATSAAAIPVIIVSTIVTIAIIIGIAIEDGDCDYDYYDDYDYDWHDEHFDDRFDETYNNILRQYDNVHHHNSL